jgi:hypothetical protein
MVVGIILSVKLPPEYPSTPPVLDGKVLKGAPSLFTSSTC